MCHRRLGRGPHRERGTADPLTTRPQDAGHVADAAYQGPRGASSGTMATPSPRGSATRDALVIVEPRAIPLSSPNFHNSVVIRNPRAAP